VARPFQAKYQYGENGIASQVFLRAGDGGMQRVALRIGEPPLKDSELGLWYCLSLGRPPCMSNIIWYGMRGTYGVTIRELPVRKGFK